jgi:hypothetical protein
MKKLNKLIAVFAAATATSALTASAALVSISDVTGHHGGQRFGEEVGTLGEMIDLSGMTTPDLDDPSTWTATSSSWQDEWQSATLLNSVNTDNAKIGWLAIDFGTTVTDLESLYLWNVRENNTRNVANYNIYYATAPTVALPGDPGQDNLNVDVGAAGGAGDYNFASGGWIQLGSTANMSDRFDSGEANIANDVVALGGISARYIAIEILSNDGDANRVGLAEIAVTRVVPEPSTTALLGLGGLTLILRRRK